MFIVELYRQFDTFKAFVDRDEQHVNQVLPLSLGQILNFFSTTRLASSPSR